MHAKELFIEKINTMMMRENENNQADPRFAEMIMKFKNSLDNNLYIGTPSDLIVINFKDFNATSHCFERLPEIIHIDICWKNNVIILISRTKGI